MLHPYSPQGVLSIVNALGGDLLASGSSWLGNAGGAAIIAAGGQLSRITLQARSI